MVSEKSETVDPVALDGGERKSEVLLVPHQIESLIRETFPECPETMIAIARAESSMRADAVNINRNGTQDTGLFQINDVHGYDREYLKDVRNNIKVAREVYEKQGLTAWVSYNYAILNNKQI